MPSDEAKIPSDDQTPVDFVDSCFRLLLRREADAEGRKYHLARLKNGQSRLSVLVSFVTSDEFRARAKANQWVPDGHFYSPYPSTEEIAEYRRKRRIPGSFPAVDFQDVEQRRLMDAFAMFYPEIPFQDEAVPGLRYRYINGSYPSGDAIPSHCMIRHLRPKRIIEVGSGNSSCMIMDTNDRFFGSGIELTFVEPYPKFFLSLLRPGERDKVRLLALRLQDVPLAEFERLGENDILFIDSTHVSKLNSDVNYFLFEIFPRLTRGVFIHVHDIFYPFEYPLEWLEEGRAWNESYILRAFLQFNDHFKMRFFNSYLFGKHRAWFKEKMPRCLEYPGGSLWLEKVK
jgi:hypothetical protein